MNKTLKYALGAVLSVGVIAPAVAQDNFPDVPENHWAYEALARMKKEGLLVGYPDGLFRGNRPASRYELAVAIHATYAHLKGITDNLQRQIDALRGPTGDGVTQAQLKELRDALAALQNDVNNMKGWGDDIANLKRLAQTFERELAALGVDVEAMKKDLADLAARVGKLERDKLPINIHGDVNLLALGGMSSGGRPGITVDGRPTGVQDTIFAGPTFAPTGLTQDLSVFHEAALKITSNNETGPKWRGTLVVGNMIDETSIARGPGSAPRSGPNVSQSTTSVGSPFMEGRNDVYLQDLAVSFDTSLAGQGLSAELGRTGYSISPYIYMRPDTTPYYQNDRWDSGKWTFDGAILGFHFGSASLDLIGGRVRDRLTVNGFELNPMIAGAVGHRFTPGNVRPIGLPNNDFNRNGVSGALGGVPIDSVYGARLNVPISDSGKLDLAYIWLESNTGVNNAGLIPPLGAGRAANRVEVFGGDLKWNFGALSFEGGYAQSNVKNGGRRVVNRDNYAWHLKAAYEAERWGLMAGYREIQPQFGAPGDWGRIGMWWNPTDIRGFDIGAHFNLSDALKLSAQAQFYNGLGKTVDTSAFTGVAGTTSTGMATNDRIRRYVIDLGYQLNEGWHVNLGAEWVDWDLADRGAGLFRGGRPRERWYNLGLGYNLSDMARLSFLWQWSDYDARGTAGFQPFSVASGDRATGSLLSTQLTVKF